MRWLTHDEVCTIAICVQNLAMHKIFHIPIHAGQSFEILIGYFISIKYVEPHIIQSDYNNRHNPGGNNHICAKKSFKAHFLPKLFTT